MYRIITNIGRLAQWLRVWLSFLVRKRVRIPRRPPLFDLLLLGIEPEVFLAAGARR